MMSKSFKDQLKVHSSTLFLANYIRDCNSPTTRQGWSKQRYLFCCSCLNTYGVCRGTRSISTGIKDSFHKNAIIVSKREVSRVLLFLQPSNNHLSIFHHFYSYMTSITVGRKSYKQILFFGIFLTNSTRQTHNMITFRSFFSIHIRN